MCVGSVGECIQLSMHSNNPKANSINQLLRTPPVGPDLYRALRSDRSGIAGPTLGTQDRGPGYKYCRLLLAVCTSHDLTKSTQQCNRVPVRYGEFYPDC